jgi:hypothetical protein
VILYGPNPNSVKCPISVKYPDSDEYPENDENPYSAEYPISTDCPKTDEGHSQSNVYAMSVQKRNRNYCGLSRPRKPVVGALLSVLIVID